MVYLMIFSTFDDAKVIFSLASESHLFLICRAGKQQHALAYKQPYDHKGKYLIY